MPQSDQNGVVRFSARDPHPVYVLEKKDSMLIDDIDWKWDDSIKDLVPYVKGKTDLQAITDSYKDSTGVKNILAMIAQGDYSMLHPAVNLGDISEFPDNIHDAKLISDAAKKAATAIDGLKIKDADGQYISASKLSEKQNEEIQKLVQAYLDGKTAQEGAKDDGKHE